MAHKDHMSIESVKSTCNTLECSPSKHAENSKAYGMGKSGATGKESGFKKGMKGKKHRN